MLFAQLPAFCYVIVKSYRNSLVYVSSTDNIFWTTVVIRELKIFSAPFCHTDLRFVPGVRIPI